jgi:Tol biopolymer transport system component
VAAASLVIAASGVLAGWWLAGRAGVSGDAPPRVDLVFPPGQQVVTTVGSPAVISPDGQRIAYTARTTEGVYLYLRSLDDFEPARLPGTEGASAPFFSPDGQWIGFCAGGRILKAPVTGGAPQAIADCRGLLLGASWGSDGTIVYSDSTVTGLWRVGAGGGAAAPLTEPDVRMNAGHRFPYQLPDGGVLFSTENGDGRAELGYLPAGADTWAILADGDARFTGMKYLPGGQLLFGQSGSIKVVGFDPAAGRLTGEPRVVATGVASSPVSQYVYFSAADSGRLIYVPMDAAESDSSLVLLDATGEMHEFAKGPGGLGEIRLSPDGSRLAVAVRTAGLLDPWVYDVASGRGIRLTRGAEADFPVWAPDSQRLVVGTGRSLSIVAADGTGSPERILEREHRVYPMSWSGGGPSGDRIVFAEADAGGSHDLFVLSPATGVVTPLLGTAANEWDARVSPDGRWLAYVSDETGRNEVYVQSFPDAGRKERVSLNGGETPRWSPSGRDLFYRRDSTIFVVQVDDAGQPGAATQVVAAPPGVWIQGGFDVAPGGRRFVVVNDFGYQIASVKRLRLVLQ